MFLVACLIHPFSKIPEMFKRCTPTVVYVVFDKYWKIVDAKAVRCQQFCQYL